MNRRILFVITITVAVIPSFKAVAANLDDFLQCGKVANKEERLQCFDALVKQSDANSQASKPEGVGNWKIERSTSPMDDSKIVIASLQADAAVRDSKGFGGMPQMIIRCQGGSLEAFIETNFQLEIYDDKNYNYGEATQVAFRLDKEKQYTRILAKSTDHTAVFLDEPVKDIERFVGKKKLTLQFTGRSSGTLTTTFALTGLEKALIPIKEVCKWSAK